MTLPLIANSRNSFIIPIKFSRDFGGSQYVRSGAKALKLAGGQTLRGLDWQCTRLGVFTPLQFQAVSPTPAMYIEDPHE